MKFVWLEVLAGEAERRKSAAEARALQTLPRIQRCLRLARERLECARFTAALAAVSRAGKGLRVAPLVVLFMAFSFPVQAQRQMEQLGRGLVAVRTSTSQAYVGWRLLATDPTDIGFNVYRSINGGAGIKRNSQPITNTTDFTDSSVNFAQSNAWYVVPVINGVEQSPSAAFGLSANVPTRQYIPIPLVDVIGGANPPYDVKFCWVGDFDGDGEYDFLVDRLSTTANVRQYLQAYKRDGTFLWQMDMGPNSTLTSGSSTIVYEPSSSAISVGDKDNVTVYDMDGDGKAEVLVRTSNGVVFGDGSVKSGGASDDVQFLSVVNGMTGAELASATVPNPFISDGPLNSHAGILYGDGVHPYVFLDGENRVGNGAFQRIATAWTYQNGQLTQRWSRAVPSNVNESRAHQVRITDVNHDGKDELVEIGSAVSGETGLPIYDTEILHGDRYHITDIDPDRPGLETYLIQQYNPTLLATALMQTENGQFIKKWYAPDIMDVGRGVTLDMDPNHRGCEMYSTQPGIFDCKGNQIFVNNLWAPEGVWWDADLSREFEDGANSGATSPVINKFDPSTGGTYRLYSIYTEGVHQAYGGRAAFWGDILGDWREELVLVASDYSEIRIYTTKIPATNRLYSLMQNPQYRCESTCKGYYEANYVDYYLGTGMEPPAPPPISDAQLVWRGNANNVWNTSTANWFTNNLWISNDTAVAFHNDASVLFDLSGARTAIALSGSLTPSSVTVHSPKDYTFSGPGQLTGAMPLTKAGAGTLTFTGTNTYTGDTLIAEGPFIVNGSLPNSAVTVRGGVWLDGRLSGQGVIGSPVVMHPGAGASPGQGTNSPGTLTIASNVTLADRTLNDFDLSDDPSGTTKTNDLLVVGGNLTLQGTNALVIHQLDATLSPGVYPLIHYGGTLIGGLNNLIVSGLEGLPIALTNPPGQIALVVQSSRAPATLTWTGGLNGNVWDALTTSNWLNGASKDWFVPGDTVRFDSAGISNPAVTLAGSLNVAGVAVASAANYTFNGSGAIIGSGGLSKSGSGTLTINTLNNTFTGATVVSSGTVSVPQLGAVGAPSPLGNPAGGYSSLILSGGSTLRVTGESYTDRGMTLASEVNVLEIPNASDQVTIAGEIVGSGGLRKTGSGTIALTTQNSFSGGMFIQAGTVALGGDVADRYAFGTGTVTLEGGTIIMSDDSGTYNSTYWNLVVPAGATGRLNADSRVDMYGSLAGAGTFYFHTPYVRTTLYGDWSAFTGQINVITDGDGGDFRINNSYGYANAAIDFANNVYAYRNGGGSVSIGAVSGSSGATMSGTTWTVGAKNTDTTFAGTITGDSITKVGTGKWTLTGANTYTGTTTVSGGTLLVNGDNSAATGNVTVNSAGTLGGTGTIGGNTTVTGTLSPGDGLGTLAFNGNVSLTSGGKAYMEIRKTPTARDLAEVTGTLAYDGTLQVVNLAGTFSGGDSFKIFNASSYSGSFANYNLPLLPVGLAWDVSALNSSGTISVVVSNVVTGPQELTWKGDGVTNIWDINTTANWLTTNGAAAYFANGDSVTFTDAGSNNAPVVLRGSLEPASVTVNATKDYLFGGSGSLAGTNALIKSGSGTLSIATPNSYSGDTIINGGTLRLINLGNGLAHRWSFNGSLVDSVGNQPASIVDVGGNNATLGADAVTLAGGARSSSDYVSLGANLLPNTTAPVTIELWATQNAAQNWARIFDFGSSSAENLFMSWTMGTSLNSDRVEWKDATTANADNSNQPYILGTEYHIAMVIEPGAGAGGTTRVRWYSAPSSNGALGTAKGSFDTANTLAAMNDVNCWLGRSEYTSDYTATASYNEVRVWNRALSTDDLQVLHTVGPDANMTGSLPALTAVELNGSTATLENQTGNDLPVGSLSGVTGSEVKLTSGGLVTGGDDSSTEFVGSFTGTGGLSKQGTGSLTLSGANTYTGATVISDGSLLVNGSLGGTPVTVTGGLLGGNGSIGGAAVVQTGATLAPGTSIGTLSFGSSLSLNSGSTSRFEISAAPLANDAVVVTGNLLMGGSLVVTNVNGALMAGQSFALLSAGSRSGSFSSMTLPALNAGLVWNTNALFTVGTLSVISVAPPLIDAVQLVDGNIVMSGSGGAPGNSYYVLSSTNVSLPLDQWMVLQTNVFDGAGDFVCTNAFDINAPQRYYRLRYP